jgi:hypothetical protein
MIKTLQAIERIFPGAYIDMTTSTPLDAPEFDRVNYEERHFTCDKCKAEKTFFVPEANGALRIDCSECFEVYWWSRKHAKLYHETTRRELPEKNFTLCSVIVGCQLTPF